ncbi:hypothetical protein HN695_04080 [Candidatus Woesearchaeota archaeon]|jgi:hypothetical protein|nr:hypothetical protein [Candidatus Woesearchaeota archaeon]MBT5272327.1 hypothetical protein [Candidatus Woesearchaeota archaeon]MBT6040656.1 hypothetical protein [Candidatus Woesearchaeota archaeon]MBT6336599.1 hypothetical protein [Candidatus Woesearchaeota archaeon]MBT7927489.1 hypothetical protein [Candidatus Woesearchaeota archaeon]
MLENNMQEKREKKEQIRYRDLSENQVVIDYACTGNSGRSPLAEAIATDEIQRLNLEDKILAISSGTNRKVMDGKIPPIELQYMVLERSLARNTELQSYNEKEAAEVQELLSDKENTTIQYQEKGSIYKKVRKYESRARKIFTKEEHEFRERAVKELGVKTKIKHGGQQTEPNEKIMFFYGLAKSNEDKAKEFYKGHDFRPEFNNLGIENTFGLSYERYIEMARDLKTKVEETIKYVAQKTA